MSEEKPKRSLRECLEALEKLTAEKGKCAYRGQKSEEWAVESSASRRLKNSDVNFVEYHRKLLESADMDGYRSEDGQKLHDLELLANLRHHGAATCLIDFTRNFFVALWFACQKSETDGKVFILNITNKPTTFVSLEKSDLEHKGGIEAILTFSTRSDMNKKESFDTFTASYWYWAPPHGLNRRILKQDSLFIFGEEKIDENYLKSISISEGSKSDILDELSKLGITRESLFKDLPGFSALHGPDEPLQEDFAPGGHEPSPESSGLGGHEPLPERLGSEGKYFSQYDKSLQQSDELLLQGNELLQQANFESAIRKYDQAIEQKRDDADAYFGRGAAKFSLFMYKEAIEDFNKAIEYKTKYIDVYSLRGIAHGLTENFEDAKSDFTEMIKHKPDYAEAYSARGAINLKLNDYDAAMEDVNNAISLDPHHAQAHLDRGLIKFERKDFTEALKDFDTAVNLNPNLPLAHYGRGNAKRALGDISRAREDYIREKTRAEERGETQIVEEIDKELAKLDKEKDPA